MFDNERKKKKTLESATEKKKSIQKYFVIKQRTFLKLFIENG